MEDVRFTGRYQSCTHSTYAYLVDFENGEKRDDADDVPVELGIGTDPNTYGFVHVFG